MTSSSLEQGWDWQGVPLLQLMLCALTTLLRSLSWEKCGMVTGVFSGMAVGCSELVSAEGSVPSGVLSLAGGEGSG